MSDMRPNLLVRHILIERYNYTRRKRRHVKYPSGILLLVAHTANRSDNSQAEARLIVFLLR